MLPKSHLVAPSSIKQFVSWPRWKLSLSHQNKLLRQAWLLAIPITVPCPGEQKKSSWTPAGPCSCSDPPGWERGKPFAFKDRAALQSSALLHHLHNGTMECFGVEGTSKDPCRQKGHLQPEQASQSPSLTWNGFRAGATCSTSLKITQSKQTQTPEDRALLGHTFPCGGG